MITLEQFNAIKEGDVLEQPSGTLRTVLGKSGKYLELPKLKSSWTASHTTLKGYHEVKKWSILPTMP